MKDIQNKVWKFCEKYKLNEHIRERFVNLVSNLDKHGNNIMKLSDHGREPLKYKEELKLEVGQLFFDIINLSNTLNIDLNEALETILAKYEKK